ncbi:MAG: class I SAM-dependent methyltransferase [Pseudomonadota bacterium]
MKQRIKTALRNSLLAIPYFSRQHNYYNNVLADPFVGWTRIGIPGWCDNSNIKMLDYCMRHIPAGAVIEIGSFCGLSTGIISHTLRRYGKQNPFFSMDDWQFEGFIDTGSVSNVFTHNDWSAYTENLFKLSTALTTKGINHSHIKVQSNEFFNLWSSANTVTDLAGRNVLLGGEIAFAYIDGDHSYAQAKQDFLNIDKFLAPGGYIFFDDSANNSKFGCHKVALEVKELPAYKHIYKRFIARGNTANYCFQKK